MLLFRDGRIFYLFSNESITAKRLLVSLESIQRYGWIFELPCTAGIPMYMETYKYIHAIAMHLLSSGGHVSDVPSGRLWKVILPESTRGEWKQTVWKEGRQKCGSGKRTEKERKDRDKCEKKERGRGQKEGKKAGRAKEGEEGVEEQRKRGDLRGDFFKTAPVLPLSI